MRSRVLALAGLTASANSYAPAARRSSLKSQVQRADSESDRALASRRRVRLNLDRASSESLESIVQGVGTAGTVNESQVTAFIPSDGLLAGNSQTKAESQNDSTSFDSDDRRPTRHVPTHDGGRIQTLATRRFRDALPKLGGDELDKIVLSTAIPSVRSSTHRLTSLFDLIAWK